MMITVELLETRCRELEEALEKANVKALEISGALAECKYMLSFARVDVTVVEPEEVKVE